MLLQGYLRAAEELGLERRRGVEEALKAVEEVGAAILVAPTAYGKSTASLALGLAAYEQLWEEGLAKVLHVLPMSSIVEDLYYKALRRVLKRGGGLDRLEEEAVEEGVEWIGYQTWALDSPLKDPLYIKSTLIYTTFDSFVLNLFKVTPMRSLRAPYEAARAAVMRSIAVLDEAHLYASVDSVKTFTALVGALRELRRFRVSTLVATATMPSVLMDILRRELEAPAVVVTSVGCGEGLEEQTPGGEVEAELVRERDPVELAASASGRVLMVFNTVRRAVSAYKRLRDRGVNAVLIHGRLTLGDRRRAVSALEKARVVVATQVVEAGVDLSANVLITDFAPLPSLVQRIGRVARRGGRGAAYILPRRGEDSLVYDEAELKATEEVLSEYSWGRDIHWRYLCRREKRSYVAALDKFGEKAYGALELRLDTSLLNALYVLSGVAVSHRRDALKALEKFCGFVHNSAAAPIITCTKYDKRFVAMVDIDYLSRRRGEKTVAEILLVDERRRMKALVLSNVELRGCKTVEEGVYLCEVDAEVLLRGDGSVDCRKALRLEYEVFKRLGFEEAPSAALLGLYTDKYVHGLGFEVDVDGA